MSKKEMEKEELEVVATENDANVEIATNLNISEDVIGIIAPAPQYNTNLSYIPKISNNAPITTNKEVTCPGVNLVLSNINCEIMHTVPQNRNA